jgi:asparagine synthase (glutamine-hydrolysing)
MCGICGIAAADSHTRVDADRVVAMRDALAHRGPDGAGIKVLPGVTLGHRRLSIIDLEHGDQPMCNEDETVWVTFNGEIYNYAEVRAQLAARGHVFRTRSDTEVLVHGYEEWGDDFVHHLNGMFGFALVDTRRRRTLLVRDHLGIKPLFYAVGDEGLVFGSEIKAVLLGLRRPSALRHESLQEYLIFRYVAWDRTFYQDVLRVPPGHVAVWEQGRVAVRRYWFPPAAVGDAAPSFDEAVRTLDGHLGRSVERQLMSDVPLGAFCSGGVDSGLVTTYAARGSRAFQTFSVGFEDPVWDETPLARDTARRAGTEHHVIVATPGALADTLRRLIHYHDEPLSHPNAVPLYLLSGLARKHVKVVLTGEGADELFAGYPRYHLARVRGALQGVPHFVRAGATAGLRAVPGHRAAKAALLLPATLDDALLLNSAYVEPAVVARLTGGPVDGALATRRQLVAETLVPGDAIGALSRYELLTYLTCALERMDRMSMAHGLEGRVPFLDLDLVQWGLGLPSRFKLGLRTNKRILKQLARRRLSRRIVDGPKSGFGLPLGDWFRGAEFASLVRRMRDPAHPAAAHFDARVLQTAIADHQAGRVDHGELLWLVANVFLWSEPLAAASEPAVLAPAVSG